MSSEFIGYYDLQCGQKIEFYDKGEKIYGPFTVFNRDDTLMYDHCLCILIDENGKKYDYCPRMGQLDYESLPYHFDIKLIK